MGKGNPFGNMGNIPGLGNMMKQVQKMAEDTQRLEEELGQQRIEATSGGGMVKAVANGKGEVLEIKIDPQVVDPQDVEMLEDLVVSAVREALEKGIEMKQARLQELTGGLNIPGLF
ncbi:MAG: YbaB/EbfC family nucleoid-associated protein [Armatimonadetes bacterium]|nr:YbaB/EbfC family nucleoid-associated protein [Armatimonadota bacterium]